MVSTCEADTIFVSKTVMSLNGLSFVSARPAPQPCVSVLVVWGIQDLYYKYEYEY